MCYYYYYYMHNGIRKLKLALTKRLNVAQSIPVVNTAPDGRPLVNTVGQMAIRSNRKVLAFGLWSPSLRVWFTHSNGNWALRTTRSLGIVLVIVYKV